jgi:AGCS family alanine or glycine:cation symporter
MESIQSIFVSVNDFVWGWTMIVFLVGTGIYLTFRLGFVQLRMFRHGLRVIAGKYDDPDDEGDINHFQALSAALSATIGIGNIAGVATAVHWGGPGALFWMWVTGFFGMAVKFTTCTLAHRFRTIHPDGSASGGPMYYIERGLGPSWKPMAAFFAACAAFTSFNTPNMVQSNTMAVALERDFGVAPWITGIVLAAVVGLVIIGGIRRIGLVASRLVPFMCIVYVAGAVAILLIHMESIPGAFALILSKAFTPTAEMGGFLGSAWVTTLTWGVKRGLFSNEAGLGSAPIAHAAAKTRESVREGVVAMLGPFVDTLLICTITGLVIVTTGVWTDKFPEEISGNNLPEVVCYGVAPEEFDAGAAASGPRLTGALPVVDGRPGPGVTLFHERGTIESPRIFGPDGAGGLAPLTGEAALSDAGTLTGFTTGGDPLVLRGEMLLTGAELTAQGFSHGLPGKWGNYIVTIGVILFAFSTALAWSYYGDRSVEYLFGRRGILPYRVLYVGFIFLGSVLTLNMVWTLADIAMGFMAFPNLIAIVALSGMTVRITRDYVGRFGGRERGGTR